MTSSSELLPPFSASEGCVSGRLNAAPSRPEEERKLEAGVGVEDRPLGWRDPGNSGWENGTGKPESMLAMPGFMRKGGSEEEVEDEDEDGTEDEEGVSIPAWVEDVVLVEQVEERVLLDTPSPSGSVGNMACRSPRAWPACCRRCDLLPREGGVMWPSAPSKAGFSPMDGNPNPLLKGNPG